MLAENGFLSNKRYYNGILNIINELFVYGLKAIYCKYLAIDIQSMT